VKSRISGKEAVYVARKSEGRRPVKLLASDRVDASIWRATEHANSCRMSPSTFAERCPACGAREYGYDPLLSYAAQPTVPLGCIRGAGGLAHGTEKESPRGTQANGDWAGTPGRGAG
jgi:hypothetical protein